MPPAPGDKTVVEFKRRPTIFCQLLAVIVVTAVIVPMTIIIIIIMIIISMIMVVDAWRDDTFGSSMNSGGLWAIFFIFGDGFR